MPVTVAARRITARGRPHRTLRALVVRPAESGDAAYPVVAFGHGLLQRPWRYRSLLIRIAAAGYLVVAPGSQAGPLPRHGRLADDLCRALDWARSWRCPPERRAALAGIAVPVRCVVGPLDTVVLSAR